MVDRNKLWQKAIKLYKSLNCPTDTMDIINDIIPNQQTWNVILSTRSRGKTTNLLLFGLCLYKVGLGQVALIRQRETMTTRKEAQHLCEVINSGQYNYLNKIFDNEFNHLDYYAGKWTLQNLDDELNVIAKDTDYCIRMLSVDKSEQYKSNLNIPNCSLIIFDEFLSRRGYIDGEFEMLCDIISTITRDKTQTPIYLLGNMVDRYSVYFDELQINDIISSIEYGEHRTLKCGETTLHIYMLPITQGKQHKANLFYFGWKNPKLTAINGLSGVWAMPSYTKPPKGQDYIKMCHRYICKNGKYACMELRKYPTTYYVVCYPSTYEDYLLDNNVCFIDSKASTEKYRYNWGTTTTDRFFETLYKTGFFRYTNNSIGALVESFYRDIK